MSELTPQVPHSLPRERLIPFSSPVQTSIPLRLQATWSRLGGVKMRSLMTACHWLHQMERSCCARSMTLPSLSLANPASLSQAWMPNFSASCQELWMSWAWSGLLPVFISFPHWPVQTRCGRVRRALHCGTNCRTDPSFSATWDCLGLRVNLAKSALSPSQWISFLGTVFDSVKMRATVTHGQHALAI